MLAHCARNIAEPKKYTSHYVDVDNEFSNGFSSYLEQCSFTILESALANVVSSNRTLLSFLSKISTQGIGVPSRRDLPKPTARSL